MDSKTVALEYAERGYVPIPLYNKGDGNKAKDGKDPHAEALGRIFNKSSWEDVESITSDQVDRMWFGSYSGCNVGLVLGNSGLFGVDLDTYKEGYEETELIMELRELATVIHKPGSGGTHLIFSLPEDVDPKEIENGKPFPGVDVKCWNGYFVMPDSVSDSGPYEAVAGKGLHEVRIPATIPKRLLEQLRTAPESRKSSSDSRLKGKTRDSDGKYVFPGELKPDTRPDQKRVIKTGATGSRGYDVRLGNDFFQEEHVLESIKISNPDWKATFTRISGLMIWKKTITKAKTILSDKATKYKGQYVKGRHGLDAMIFASLYHSGWRQEDIKDFYSLMPVGTNAKSKLQEEGDKEWYISSTYCQTQHEIESDKLMVEIATPTVPQDEEAPEMDTSKNSDWHIAKQMQKANVDLGELFINVALGWKSQKDGLWNDDAAEMELYNFIEAALDRNWSNVSQAGNKLQAIAKLMIVAGASVRMDEFYSYTLEKKWTVPTTAGHIKGLTGYDSLADIRFVEKPQVRFLGHYNIVPDFTRGYDRYREIMLPVFDGDEEQLRIFQLAMATTFIGDTSFRKAFVFSGPGKTGKTTAAYSFRSLSTQLYVTTHESTFLGKDSGILDVQNFNHATLLGARCVMINEAEYLSDIRTGIFKAATGGGDILSFTVKGTEAGNYDPQYSLLILTNTMTGFISNYKKEVVERLVFIPFIHRFEGLGGVLDDFKEDQELRQEMFNFGMDGVLMLARMKEAHVDFPEGIGSLNFKEQEQIKDAPGAMWFRDCVVEDEDSSITYDECVESYNVWSKARNAPRKLDIRRKIGDQFPDYDGARTEAGGIRKQPFYVGFRLQEFNGDIGSISSCT